MEKYPEKTAEEAARIIENSCLLMFVTDPELKTELTTDASTLSQARCWGVKNQGMLRAATAMIRYIKCVCTSYVFKHIVHILMDITQ